MSRALALAARGEYQTAPNPQVGSVIEVQGSRVGEGFHQRVGGPHAEVEALRAAGGKARGGTMWVTLEPCSHLGRTPPCVEAVLESGIRRLVVAHLDPDPRVSGRGVSRLREAGIEVEIGDGLDACVGLNWKYLTSKIHARPGVTLKWAMSLDGKIATVTGESQWISSPEAREWSLSLRETHDAILVGSETVLADDPRLNRRLGLADGEITRVILDRRLRTPVDSAIFSTTGEVLVFTESDNDERRQALSRVGANVLTLPAVSPQTVVEVLHQRGVQSLLVEGGGQIHGAFFSNGVFDRVAIDCAPMILGGHQAPGAVGGSGFPSLGEAPRLDLLTTERRGSDVIMTGFRSECLQDLSKNVAE